VSVHIHSPAAKYSGKKNQYPKYMRFGGPKIFSGRFWECKNIVPLSGFKQQTVLGVVYSLYRLRYNINKRFIKTKWAGLYSYLRGMKWLISIYFARILNPGEVSGSDTVDLELIEIFLAFLESANFETEDEGLTIILVHISADVNRHYLWEWNVDRTRRVSYTMADFEINGIDSVDSAINNGY